jgi:hypothetical protein
MSRRFQFSLRALLLWGAAIGPALLIGRWLMGASNAVFTSFLLATIAGLVWITLCAVCFFAGVHFDREN